MNQPSESKHHNAFMKWKHSYSGRAAWVVLCFAVAYVFGSLAIDNGSLWQWGVAALFAIDGVYNIIRLIGKLYGRKGTAKQADQAE
jgi:hypothetical protein